MGQSKSKGDDKGGLFSWQKLPTPDNETIHYDPRYEHIRFVKDCLLVSDYHNRIFEWEGKVDDNQQPLGYQIKSFKKYQYDNSSGSQAGKRFDADASSIAWIKKTNIHYFDINNEKMYIYDVSEWLSAKYGENNTAKIAQPKAIINLGNGQVLFMVLHYKGTDKTDLTVERGTDIVHMDIMNEKEIKTITIQSELLQNHTKYQCVYWGFQLNPTGKEISILVQGEKNVTYVLFVSLLNGNIIWQSRFDFVHDLSFNDNGKFACVFERPRKTEYGYVHVLNLARLEWICQVRLTYGTSPLGWDGFTWMNDSLVFMAPFELKVVSPGALEWRIAETKKQNELEKKLREEMMKKVQQEEDAEDEAGDGDNDGNNDGDAEQKDKEKENVITPAKFDEILQQQKSKEICVLSIGERWWDLEKETTDLIYKEVSDEHITHLILEYSGLGWAMIRFPYPKDEFNKGNKNEEDPNAKMLLQGAQSEVFNSGVCGDFNVLLLATIARDPRTKIFNHWIFTACTVPKTFGEMWKNPKIQQGVIGQITNVNETSNLKPLDAYKCRNYCFCVVFV